MKTLSILIASCAILAGCTELNKDLPEPVTPGVQVHERQWIDTSSTGFHGAVIRRNNGDYQSCLTCHGWDFNGGTSGVSCISCHQSEGGTIHGSGWLDPSAANFHGNAIRANNWDMRPCKSCHGATYSGGRVPVSCRDCHNQGAGPENCATCHGGTNPAPPRDLSGNTATTAHGVGAHQRHLTGGGAVSAYQLRCGECHNVPGTVYTAGHVDSPSPAEVFLTSALAFADTSDVPRPVGYNANDNKCSNTFCHGNWSLDSASAQFPGVFVASKMVGANRAVLWTGGAAEVACGTCHGTPANPVPSGHLPFPIDQCGACHDQIVNTAGVITNKVKHLNGKINVFSQEWDF